MNIGRKLIEELDTILPIPFLWAWTEEGVLALLLDFHKVNTQDRKKKSFYSQKRFKRSPIKLAYMYRLVSGNFMIILLT